MPQTKPARRAKSDARRRDGGGRFDGPPAVPGMGSVSHRVRVLNNPKGLTARRSAAHAKAYPDTDEDDC